MQSAERIRDAVDNLRSDTITGTVRQDQVKADLIGFLKSRGLFDADERASTMFEMEAFHRTGSVHLCPWDTCEATRHN